MIGDTLLVLMWKHFKVRTRRYIYTFLELASTISLFLVLFLFRHSLNPRAPSGLTENSMQVLTTEPLAMASVTTPPYVLYSPRTDFTDEIMNSVGEKLGLRRLNSISGSTRRGFYGITPETAPEDVNKPVYDEAIVVFQDANGTSLPEQLRYTIRMKENFMTHLYDSQADQPGPHEAFGTIYEPFMGLQWAIDTTFLELLTNKSISQKLSLQEFPYPEKNASKTNVVIIISYLTKIICVMSLMLVFVLLMSKLMEERTTGIQQLIKMVGVSPTAISTAHFLNALPAGLVYSIVGTVLLTVSSNPLIVHTSGVYIWLLLILHFGSVATMAFACSYIVSSTKYAVSLSCVTYTTLWLPVRLAELHLNSRALVLLTGLAPHMPVYWFWAAVGTAEWRGAGATLSSRDQNGGNILSAYTCLVLQIAIFSCLSWYLEHVRPGKHGAPLPWNFLFQKQYWYPQKVMPECSDAEEETLSQDPRYFEQPAKDKDIGVKIVNVSKDFGSWGRPKTRALSHVSLDIYRGEITALLGHNGAGKTTLMSIITGMLQATEGDVYVNGLHSVHQREHIHKHLGLCPQHNLFFPDLTVLEHVMFFTIIKGASMKAARAKSMALLKKVGISDKADSNSSELSGGMKRRLQLSCALAGDADVLILDEPTSGLDVETRRELWNLLLSLRGDRTVLLTTHFMEEADALGDRVAALHGGRVKCHATPMYLKKSVGSGYRLTLTTEGTPDVSALSAAVTRVIPTASTRETSVNSVSYTLPTATAAAYPLLFDTLEQNRTPLRIQAMGMGLTTLEEVFLELCKDVDTSMAEDELDSAPTEPTYNKITGAALWLRQAYVLFKRQLKFTRSKLMTFTLFQVLVPIFVIVMFTRSLAIAPVSTALNGQAAMNLDMYRDSDSPRVLYNVNWTDGKVDWAALKTMYPHVDFVHSSDIYNDVLKVGKDSLQDYYKYLLGIELNATDAMIHYTTTVRHAAPIALNLLTNVLSMLYQPYGSGDTVATVNDPIPNNYRLTQLAARQPMDTTNVIIWSVFTVIILLATILNAVSLPCRERANCARHIHVMSGCAPLLYWAVTWLYHMAVYAVTLLPAVLVAAVVFDDTGTMAHAPLIETLTQILLLGAGAFFALMFVLSFVMSERLCAIALVFCVFVFGFITPAVQIGKEMIDPDTAKLYNFLMAIPLALMPPHTLSLALMRALQVGRLNAYCDLNYDSCPKLLPIEEDFNVDACCASPSHQPYSYASMADKKPAPLVVVLLAQLVGYMTLVVVCQHGVFNGLWDRAWNTWLHRYRPGQPPPTDEVARKEARYCEATLQLPKDKIDDVMVVHDLHKNYYKLLGKSCDAVRGISFSVKKGECFGLLGVNGAGKSTTFKMLTGEERPTRGRIYAAGHFLDTDKTKYMWSLGYCPQFFGLDAFLTGRENLELMLTMRGLDAADVRAQTDAWIHVVGLGAYASRAVGGYSGGCARRLGAGCGLAAGAPLAALDEPTCGVDTAARRRVWRALRKGLAGDKAVIITSHSMDEMSALCDRIAILHRGVVRALGTVRELRAAYTTGHALHLKLNDTAGVDSKEEMDKLKAYMLEHFNCTLKDEHKTMLHYHINETLPYSKLFAEMEALKGQFLQIEDYSVTETTLEEVFLNLAREPSPGDDNNV